MRRCRVLHIYMYMRSQEGNEMTIERARMWVRGYTSGLTDEQVEAVAQYMVANGKSVWHASTVIVWPDRPCPCGPCEDARAS